jgi:hypothetical protein
MKYYCYQCDAEVDWLAPDSRCKKCTRLTVEEVKGECPCCSGPSGGTDG